jgi:hypothetical protein
MSHLPCADAKATTFSADPAATELDLAFRASILPDLLLTVTANVR